MDMVWKENQQDMIVIKSYQKPSIVSGKEAKLSTITDTNHIDKDFYSLCLTKFMLNCQHKISTAFRIFTNKVTVSSL